ncbi:DUF6702 family protein [Owenweeksia hongkongensis]|uniref:DUF6702 family protein n=1 Tax=Owenweeksia hongkongensis TaxID=253245 RepID=UPI003A904FA6
MGKFLLLVLLSFFQSEKHDFHTSITNAEYNPRTKSMEIAMKLFTDDLELTIKNKHQLILNLNSTNELPEADSLIYNYVIHNFAIQSGKKSVSPTFVGKEIENGITFIYLEIHSFPVAKELLVRNTVFFDTFDDQSNIVNIKLDGELESAFLKKGQETELVQF